MWGGLRVHFLGVGVGRHEDPVCPVEGPPFSVRVEDVDGGLFRGRVDGVPRCDGCIILGHLGGRGGCRAEELINVEGRDWVFGALRWWGDYWDGSGVPVLFVGGEGVEGGGTDELGLSLQDDVALCAEVFR